MNSTIYVCGLSSVMFLNRRDKGPVPGLELFLKIINLEFVPRNNK